MAIRYTNSVCSLGSIRKATQDELLHSIVGIPARLWVPTGQHVILSRRHNLHSLECNMFFTARGGWRFRIIVPVVSVADRSLRSALLGQASFAFVTPLLAGTQRRPYVKENFRATRPLLGVDFDVPDRGDASLLSRHPQSGVFKTEAYVWRKCDALAGRLSSLMSSSRDNLLLMAAEEGRLWSTLSIGQAYHPDIVQEAEFIAHLAGHSRGPERAVTLVWVARPASRPRPVVVETCPELVCPITRNAISDAVLIADDPTCTVYERSAITTWFDMGKNRNPITNLPCRRDLLPVAPPL